MKSAKPLVPESVSTVETLGVAPVPTELRSMSAGMLFLIWALASASATTPVIGLLLDHLGLHSFVYLVVVATLIGLIPAMLLAHMGRQVPVISMIMARRTWGFSGAGILALLYTVVGAGWFGLNTDVGGKILTSLFPGFGSTWYVLLGALQIALVFFGMQVLEKFYKYTAAVFLLCYAVLAYYLFTRFPLQIPTTVGPIPWGNDIDLVLSFSLLAWAYDFPTVTRFCPPHGRRESRSRTILFASMPTLGVMSAVLLMGLLGLVTLRMTGDWNIAMLGKSLPFWGEVSALGVILAIAHTNAMNLYPAVTKLLALVNLADREAPRWVQPVTVVGLGSFATLLAIVGILDVIEGFLNVLGELLFPFSFILIADWFYRKSYQVPAERFFRTSFAKAGSGWAWPAPWATAVLIGAILLDIWQPWAGLLWAAAVPTQVLVGILAAAIYLAGLHWAFRRQTDATRIRGEKDVQSTF